MNKDAEHQMVNVSGKSVENAKNPALNERNPSRNGRDTSLSNSPIPNTTSETSNPHPQTSQQIHHSDDEEEEETESLGRGRRPRPPPGFYKNLMAGKGAKAAIAVEDGYDQLSQSIGEDEEDLLIAAAMQEYALASGTEGEPRSLKEALSGEEASKWRAAVQAKLEQIEKLGTWDIVEAPADANIVSSKFVFRLKRDEHGNITKYKACLVAHGFTQKFGIDYFDTRVWIVRWETIRNLLAQAASRGSVIHQADVKNAYLNAEIKEDIYVELPPLYTDFRPLPPHLPPKRAVCKLKKGLYGTKQAGRGWYMKLRDTFIKLGYKVSTANLGVFYRFSGPDKYTIVAVATDDLTIIAESNESAQLIKDKLNQHFELVDLGEIKWLLGVHIVRDLENRTISLGQQSYIDEIIKRFSLEDARPISTLMEPGSDLTPGTPHISPIKLTARDRIFYREMIGALLYLSTVTRADVAYCISTLSRYLKDPSKTHFAAIQRAIQNLKQTRDKCLILGGKDPQLCAYSDADWASGPSPLDLQICYLLRSRHCLLEFQKAANRYPIKYRG